MGWLERLGDRDLEAGARVVAHEPGLTVESVDWATWRPPTGLTRTFPPELVDRVIAGTGRAGQRDRLLPPRVVVYFVLAMCLFTGQGYEEVARLLTEGVSWAARWSKP
ncbi:transposase domain-containing protein [Actinosynnema sp. NPDC004786]